MQRMKHRKIKTLKKNHGVGFEEAKIITIKKSFQMALNFIRYAIKSADITLRII